jgi:hypothetical protein
MQLAAYRRRYTAAEPKPTDAQMDQLLREDIRRVAERALERLRLTFDELELRSKDVDPLTAGAPRRLADQGRGGNRRVPTTRTSSPSERQRRQRRKS